MSNNPKSIVFASGEKNGGGSGFEELVKNSKTGILKSNIIAVVSNHENGGVRKKAEKWNIPFEYFFGPWTAESYQKIVEKYKTEWVLLSGWLKLVKGTDPKKTINIHPGPLPQFGGDGMYGHHVHEAVIDAFKQNKITCSAVTMHFVTKKYDEGPIFFRYPVLIEKDDTPETLAKRVNKIEHSWQSFITNLVVHQQIHWDSKNPKSLTVPNWYPFL